MSLIRDPGIYERFEKIVLVHGCRRVSELAYGDRIKTDRAFETKTHAGALHQFRDEVVKRYPDLKVELGIMDLTARSKSSASRR